MVEVDVFKELGYPFRTFCNKSFSITSQNCFKIYRHCLQVSFRDIGLLFNCKLCCASYEIARKFDVEKNISRESNQTLMRSINDVSVFISEWRRH